MPHDDVASRFAIRELIDRYHAAINLRDWEMLADIFTTDAVWEAPAPVDLRFEGRDAVAAGLRKSVLRQELLIQGSSAVVVEMTSPDTATVKSTLIEVGREAQGGRGWTAIGFYSDQVRAEADRWRFAHRLFQVRYAGDCPVPGKVFPLP